MKNLIKFFLPVLLFAFNLNPQDNSKFYPLSPDFNLNDPSIYNYQSNGSFTGTGDTGYVGTNYLPQHEGNKYQFLLSGTVGSGGVSWSQLIKTFNLDTVWDPRYFYDNIFNRWERYSEVDKMIYTRDPDNGREVTHMDFNKAPGEEFLYFAIYEVRRFWNAEVSGGEVSLFSNQYKYKGYSVELGSFPIFYNRTELYAENFGVFSFSSSQSLPGVSSNANVIMAIIYDSAGTAHEYTKHYKPHITFTPVTHVNTFLFSLDSVKVAHVYSKPGSHPYNPLNFIDTVQLESYYQKGDSIFINQKWNFTNFSLGQYKLAFSLASSLIKNGYSFYYRIYAKDKGIIPETSYSPDTGYYKCDWITGVNDEEQLIPKYYLNQNYPNPFNPLTTIEFQTPEPGIVTIKLYDILGEEIKVLLNEYKERGAKEIQFDASLLPSGIYFYRMITKNYTATKKMIILR